MHLLTRTTLLCLAVCLTAFTGAASAGTVSYDGRTLTYTGTAAADDVDISDYRSEYVRVSEKYPAQITSAPGCLLDHGAAYCKVAPGARVVANLGAGNDSLAMFAVPLATTADGGAGNDGITTDAGHDRLTGGPGDDELRAEDGNDALIGGQGRDKLDGGQGDDVLDVQDNAGDAGANCWEGNDLVKVDGGGVDGEGLDCERYERGPVPATVIGRDVVSTPGVASRLTMTRVAGGKIRVTDPGGILADSRCVPQGRATVICDSVPSTINLGDGNDSLRMSGVGGAAEIDTAATRILGGPGDDAIDIDTSATIHGGPGNDRLLGGSGRDTLTGGPGDDYVNGRGEYDNYATGAGRDTVDSRDGSFTEGTYANGENVDCGSGRDAMLLADVGDSPQYTCERFKRVDTSPRAAGGLKPIGPKVLRVGRASRPPGIVVRVRCVGGPCSGLPYVFDTKRRNHAAMYARQGVTLKAGQTAAIKMPMGSGWGSFHKRGGRFRAQLATLSGDGEGRTRTMWRKVTVVSRGGMGR